MQGRYGRESETGGRGPGERGSQSKRQGRGSAQGCLSLLWYRALLQRRRCTASSIWAEAQEWSVAQRLWRRRVMSEVVSVVEEKALSP